MTFFAVLQALADEAAAFMGVGDVVTYGTKALPTNLIGHNQGTYTQGYTTY